MHVSIIVPAHNAGATLAETLQSIQSQSYPDWEAIVVDDGSIDDTLTIAKGFSRQDERFRVLSQPQRGVCTARNKGIAEARYDWLLFLDADDLILSGHLEQLTQALKRDPELDAVYCGWAYVTPEGIQLFEECAGRVGDLFAEHAEYCFSIIHSYVVRRSLVEAVGGFDPTLRTCEDWDLWQRIARTGARFGAVPEVLAVYRIRAGSATRNGYQLFVDGLRVINQGHAPDPRVAAPHPAHINGQPPKNLSERKFELACACAGYLIGGGQDARPLLDLLKAEQYPYLDIYSVASCLFRHTLISASRPLSEWAMIWPQFSGQIDDFLVALEMSSGTANLARRTRPLFKHLLNSYTAESGFMARVRFIQAQWVLGVYKRLPLRYRILELVKRVVDRSAQIIAYHPGVQS